MENLSSDVEAYGCLIFFKKDGNKMAYPLCSGETTIGSSMDADVRLKLDNDLLEDVHCFVDVKENGNALLVNNSTKAPIILNGAILNKAKLLKDNDTFELFGKQFQYVSGKEENKQTTPNAVAVGRRRTAGPLQVPKTPNIKTKSPAKKKYVRRKSTESPPMHLKNTSTPKVFKRQSLVNEKSKSTSKLIVSKALTASRLNNRSRRSNPKYYSNDFVSPLINGFSKNPALTMKSSTPHVQKTNTDVLEEKSLSENFRRSLVRRRSSIRSSSLRRNLLMKKMEESQSVDQSTNNLSVQDNSLIADTPEKKVLRKSNKKNQSRNKSDVELSGSGTSQIMDEQEIKNNFIDLSSSKPTEKSLRLSRKSLKGNLSLHTVEEEVKDQFKNEIINSLNEINYTAETDNSSRINRSSRRFSNRNSAFTNVSEAEKTKRKSSKSLKENLSSNLAGEKLAMNDQSPNRLESQDSSIIQSPNTQELAEDVRTRLSKRGSLNLSKFFNENIAEKPPTKSFTDTPEISPRKSLRIIKDTNSLSNIELSEITLNEDISQNLMDFSEADDQSLDISALDNTNNLSHQKSSRNTSLKSVTGHNASKNSSVINLSDISEKNVFEDDTELNNSERNENFSRKSTRYSVKSNQSTVSRATPKHFPSRNSSITDRSVHIIQGEDIQLNNSQNDIQHLSRKSSRYSTKANQSAVSQDASTHLIKSSNSAMDTSVHSLKGEEIGVNLSRRSSRHSTKVNYPTASQEVLNHSLRNNSRIDQSQNFAQGENGELDNSDDLKNLFRKSSRYSTKVNLSTVSQEAPTDSSIRSNSLMDLSVLIKEKNELDKSKSEINLSRKSSRYSAVVNHSAISQEASKRLSTRSNSHVNKSVYSTNGENIKLDDFDTELNLSRKSSRYSKANLSAVFQDTSKRFSTKNNSDANKFVYTTNGENTELDSSETKTTLPRKLEAEANLPAVSQEPPKRLSTRSNLDMDKSVCSTNEENTNLDTEVNLSKKLSRYSTKANLPAVSREGSAQLSTRSYSAMDKSVHSPNGENTELDNSKTKLNLSRKSSGYSTNANLSAVSPERSTGLFTRSCSIINKSVHSTDGENTELDNSETELNLSRKSSRPSTKANLSVVSPDGSKRFFTRSSLDMGKFAHSTNGENSDLDNSEPELNLSKKSYRRSTKVDRSLVSQGISTRLSTRSNSDIDIYVHSTKGDNTELNNSEIEVNLSRSPRYSTKAIHSAVSLDTSKRVSVRNTSDREETTKLGNAESEVNLSRRSRSLTKANHLAVTQDTSKQLSIRNPSNVAEITELDNPESERNVSRRSRYSTNTNQSTISQNASKQEEKMELDDLESEISLSRRFSRYSTKGNQSTAAQDASNHLSVGNQSGVDKNTDLDDSEIEINLTRRSSRYSTKASNSPASPQNVSLNKNNNSNNSLNKKLSRSLNNLRERSRNGSYRSSSSQESMNLCLSSSKDSLSLPMLVLEDSNSSRRSTRSSKGFKVLNSTNGEKLENSTSKKAFRDSVLKTKNFNQPESEEWNNSGLNHYLAENKSRTSKRLSRKEVENIMEISADESDISIKLSPIKKNASFKKSLNISSDVEYVEDLQITIPGDQNHSLVRMVTRRSSKYIEINRSKTVAEKSRNSTFMNDSTIEVINIDDSIEENKSRSQLSINDTKNSAYKKKSSSRSQNSVIEYSLNDRSLSEQSFADDVFGYDTISLNKSASFQSSPLKSSRKSRDDGKTAALDDDSFKENKLLPEIQFASNLEYVSPVKESFISKRGRESSFSENSRSAKRRKVEKTSAPKQAISPKNDLTNVAGVKKLLSTPKPVRSPKNDLSNVAGVKKLLSTPKPIRSPKNDLTNVAGVKKLLSTPKLVNSPKNDLTNVAGVKKLLSTPKPLNSPKNDLTNIAGIKKLLSTPKPVNSPKNDLTNIVGVKTLFSTRKPVKSPKNDLTNVAGVKKLLSTPKPVKSPKNDLTNVGGVRKLMASPRLAKSPKNDLRDVRGVKKLMGSPKLVRSPKNDLTNVAGVKKLMATPKVVKSPKNDLSNVAGVKKLMATPRPVNSPKNDLSDVEGVQQLFVDNNEDLFAKLFLKKPLKTYRGKSMSPEKQNELKESRKTLGDVPFTAPRIENWVQEQVELRQKREQIHEAEKPNLNEDFTVNEVELAIKKKPRKNTKQKQKVTRNNKKQTEVNESLEAEIKLEETKLQLKNEVKAAKIENRTTRSRRKATQNKEEIKHSDNTVLTDVSNDEQTVESVKDNKHVKNKQSTKNVEEKLSTQRKRTKRGKNEDDQDVKQVFVSTEPTDVKDIPINKETKRAQKTKIQGFEDETLISDDEKITRNKRTRKNVQTEPKRTRGSKKEVKDDNSSEVTDNTEVKPDLEHVEDTLQTENDIKQLTRTRNRRNVSQKIAEIKNTDSTAKTNKIQETIQEESPELVPVNKSVKSKKGTKAAAEKKDEVIVTRRAKNITKAEDLGSVDIPIDVFNQTDDAKLSAKTGVTVEKTSGRTTRGRKKIAVDGDDQSIPEITDDSNSVRSTRNKTVKSKTVAEETSVPDTNVEQPATRSRRRKIEAAEPKVAKETPIKKARTRKAKAKDTKAVTFAEPIQVIEQLENEGRRTRRGRKAT